MERGRPRKPEGAKPQASFRISKETLETMDRLITNPPSVAIDGLRGAARSRTELIEVLVKKAAATMEGEQQAIKPSKPSKAK